MGEENQNQSSLFEEHADVVKGGETCIAFALSRGKSGLRVNVKSHPRVEEYFATLCDEGKDKIVVGLQGRHWKPVDEAIPLIAYPMEQKFIGYTNNGEGEFTLEKLGQPLVDDGYVYDPGMDRPVAKHTPKVNLSFLRLQGLSEGNGITFYVGGVYSKDAVTKILESVGVGLRRFYIDYIRPMNVSVQISTQSL